MLQKPDFGWEASAKSAKSFGGTDDSMAGYDDDETVGAAGGSGGTVGVAGAGSVGDLGIASGFAKGNFSD